LAAPIYSQVVRDSGKLAAQVNVRIADAEINYVCASANIAVAACGIDADAVRIVNRFAQTAKPRRQQYCRRWLY
jgi:hypothetical protein